MLIGTYKIIGIDRTVITTILAPDRAFLDTALDILEIDKTQVTVILEAIC